MSKPLFAYDPEFMDRLAELTSSLLLLKSRVFITVVGKRGSGKSSFGRSLRKKGIGNTPPRNVAVIDDGVMVTRFLGVFLKRIKDYNFSGELDNLTPFVPYLKRRHSVVVCVTDNPTARLSWTDILVAVESNDNVRLQRLIQRNGPEDGRRRYEMSMSQKSFEADRDYFPYIHYLKLRTDMPRLHDEDTAVPG